MPSTTGIPAGIAATMLTASILLSYPFWLSHYRYKRRQRIREKLPPNLDVWRIPGNSVEAEEQIWKDLDEVFRDAGFTLWPHGHGSVLFAPGRTYPSASGFGYVTPFRSNPTAAGGASWLVRFQYRNPLCRAARTRDGLDVVIRVIAHGSEGLDHLKILRRIATDMAVLSSNNHTLPMFQELQFEDLVFGVFPKVGVGAYNMYGYWAKNSVGDIIDMLMQMLEALAFIHDHNVAHRDAFRDNFLVQWHPESLATMTISPSRPRVYLIDFEVAVEFPPECPVDERVCTGYPLGGSFSEVEMYSRPHAPEFASRKPYDPFKLDVWQLSTSFSDFKSKVPAIDQILVDMTHPDPAHRLGAQAALDRLRIVVYSMSQESLLIEPDVVQKY